MTIPTLLTANEKLPHRAHQLAGVEKLVSASAFGLLDEVGAGKTKQVIDAAQILYLQGDIDTVVVVCPGFARSTWASDDPTLGEVAKHAWDRVPNVIFEWHSKGTDIDWHPGALNWIVTNYEFIRRDERRDDIIKQLKGRRTWLVLDESWNVKGWTQQTRACMMIRKRRADRCTLLNGTPLSDGKPLDLYYQFAILDPNIIGAKNRAHFRARYCVMGGMNGRQVVDYQNLDDLNARIAPHVLSRRTRDCFDLPPMLPPVTISAALSDSTWKIYRDMRDDTVAWLGNQASISSQAVVKLLRLSQITSGYLGGLEDMDEPAAPAPSFLGPRPQWLQRLDDEQATTTVSAKAPSAHPQGLSFGGPFTPAAAVAPAPPVTIKELGREKLDALLHFFAVLPHTPDRAVVWCQFRKELERASEALEHALKRPVKNLKGGQTEADREEVKRLLAPGSTRKGVVVGITGTGAASLNFSGASLMVFLSQGPALIKRTQAIGRIERPGQTAPMTVVDVVATGPRGQKTIDHHILKALRSKDDLAQWTVQRWRDLLKDE